MVTSGRSRVYLMGKAIARQVRQPIICSWCPFRSTSCEQRLPAECLSKTKGRTILLKLIRKQHQWFGALQVQE